ncbi:MAG: LysR substrate-binding domain-containing protein [Pseudomonadota bacterium]
MNTRFRRFDHLRRFCEIAKHSSYTEAATALHVTKGAISQQIDALESSLGFPLFERTQRGIQLTNRGQSLLWVAQGSYSAIEQEITRLHKLDLGKITVGMATYFASRWLSPRLMRFTSRHPQIGLRIQPVLGNPDLQSEDLDLAIRWGTGNWTDPGLCVERIFSCPALVTGDRAFGQQISARDIESVIADHDLLHDTDGSSAWQDWFDAAGIAMPVKTRDFMVPDPNVRVQAVIDGQGLALYDELVAGEIRQGVLFQYPDIQLSQYGYYLVYAESEYDNPAIRLFRDWIIQEAN